MADEMSLATPSEYEWNEIEAALAGADERLLSQGGGRSGRSPEQVRLIQQYAKKAAARLVAEDADDLKQIGEEYREEGRRFIEAERAAAVGRSSDESATLQSRVAASRATAEDIASRMRDADSHRSGERIILNLAGSVRRRGQAVLDFRNAGTVLEPWGNRVKWADTWPSEIDRLGLFAGAGFLFSWTNANSWPVIIDVDAAVAFSGFCTAGAGGGWFNEAHVRVLTVLGLSLPGAAPDLAFPEAQPGQQQLAGEVSADGGGLLGLGEVDGLHVAGFYGMNYKELFVPAGQRAVFEAGVLCLAGGQDGSATADFSSGEFRVLCPSVQLTMVWP